MGDSEFLTFKFYIMNKEGCFLLYKQRRQISDRKLRLISLLKWETSCVLSDLLNVYISDVPSFAYDWIRKNYYFADNVFQRVSVCEKSGEYCAVIVGGENPAEGKELYDPRSIVLSPTEG